MAIVDRIETLYNCNVTPTDVDLFVFLGNSVINGYSTAFNTLHADTIAKYFTAGVQDHCRRWGQPLLLYVTPVNYYNLFPYMNIAYNYQAALFRYGVDASMSDTMHKDQLWPRELFIFHYEAVGTSIIAAETAPNWSASNVGEHYDLMIVQLIEAVNIIKKEGKNPRVSVMFGGGGYVSTTDNDYRDEILGIVNGIRTELDDATIRFMWFKSYNYDVYFQSYRNGVDLAIAIDPLIETMDMDLFVTHIVGPNHPNSMGVITQGNICAGYWYEKYYSNRPVVTNASITGTLKNGQSIGFTYTFSGGVENTSVSADTWRQLAGTYAELYIADDAGVTNVLWVVNLKVGETYTIPGGSIGKYYKIRIFGRSMSGAIHAFPCDGAWQGPVIA
jgi:hypothetical protein